VRIEKKVWTGFFDVLLSGEKTFDLRLADFECKPGDTLILREWDPKTRQYTGRALEKKVGYVLKMKDVKFFTEEDVMKFGYQVISLI
jgi:hypothetical protein